MATSHTFFATDKDWPLIVDWLIDAGAQSVDQALTIARIPANGSEFVLYFPAIGAPEFWPDQICLNEYEENTTRWRQALLTKIETEKRPQRRMIDPQKSPAAGLKTPCLRDGQYWVSGCLWFPTSNLKKVFPELAKVCGRFERWIRKFPTVFDNRKSDNRSTFDRQICRSGVVKCVTALPDAYSLLNDGMCMVDYMTSDYTFQRCLDRWKA
ncbi:MAG: hypothetical protein JNL96_10130 [Planctomycetaceae bacterium]|nr:hypothetical protein [Planctomycetaceae bacterium]